MGGFTSRFELGDWNAVCDVCGFNFKASELKENWKGQRVCDKDFETRHPQEFVRARPETISPPWTRLAEVFQADVVGHSVAPITPSGTMSVSIDATAGNVTAALSPFFYVGSPEGIKLSLVRVDSSGNTVTVGGFSIAANQTLILIYQNNAWTVFGRLG